MKWKADIVITADDAGFYHVSVWATGANRDAAFDGLEMIKRVLGDGRRSFLRTAPNVMEDDAGGVIGKVRFSFKDEAGEWQSTVSVYEVNPSLGEALEK